MVLWLVLGSAVLLVGGIGSLLLQKRWVSVLVSLVWVIGYPIAISRLPSLIVDPDLRIWVFAPFFFGIPIWIMSGFLVLNYAVELVRAHGALLGLITWYPMLIGCVWFATGRIIYAPARTPTVKR